MAKTPFFAKLRLDKPSLMRYNVHNIYNKVTARKKRVPCPGKDAMARSLPHPNQESRRPVRGGRVTGRAGRFGAGTVKRASVRQPPPFCPALRGFTSGPAAGQGKQGGTAVFRGDSGQVVRSAGGRVFSPEGAQGLRQRFFCRKSSLIQHTLCKGFFVFCGTRGPVCPFAVFVAFPLPSVSFFRHTVRHSPPPFPAERSLFI